jgi:ribonuclease HIII
MPQDTIVLELGASDCKLFEERVKAGDLELRPVEHAHFSARGEGVVATLYLSGKLVIQGKSATLFAARYLEGLGKTVPARKKARGKVSGATIGSDEAGKGDYLGPLVVVALEVGEEGRERLAEAGVVDSKKLSDERVLRLSHYLREHYQHAVETLEPPEYNREHARSGNLNLMLADLHARAIRKLAKPRARVVVDQFASEKLLEERLNDLELHLEQRPRGEQEVSVAAASIVARAVFVERMQALSQEFAVDLHKGAGSPADRAAREFVAIHGMQALDRVAKLHFKNTKKLAAR